MPYHVPVMLSEVLDYLDCRPGGTYVDCTLGGAGHAGAICDRIQPNGLFVGIDQDRDAIDHALNTLKPTDVTVHLIHDNFINLPVILSQLHIAAVDGILMDLGQSLHQIEASGRGFSFSKDEPLDMRMNISSQKTAAQIVNHENESALATLFKTLGEERYARRIARQIVAVRRQKPIRTTGQLAQVVAATIPKKSPQRIHPATRVFMALRIAVNDELQNLKTVLAAAMDRLKPTGRICVISFHSLEDRIVKQMMKQWTAACVCPPHLPQCVCEQAPQARVLTRKVVRPSQREIDDNPMARSAKLRVAEKLPKRQTQPSKRA